VKERFGAVPNANGRVDLILCLKQQCGPMQSGYSIAGSRYSCFPPAYCRFSPVSFPTVLYNAITHECFLQTAESSTKCLLFFETMSEKYGKRSRLTYSMYEPIGCALTQQCRLHFSRLTKTCLPAVKLSLIKGHKAAGSRIGNSLLGWLIQRLDV
jgi:hypothetical protein